MKTVEVLVDAGQAIPGPALGGSLGPLGVNVNEVISEINTRTQQFKGMKVPVKIEVDDNRNYVITVGIPPTASLLLGEAGAEKGSGTPNTEKVGNVTLKQVIKIAKMKREAMLAVNLRNAVKEVIGTCVSSGLSVDDKEPKEVLADISKGSYDKYFE